MTFATSCSANSQFCPKVCARAPRGQKKEHPSTGHTINAGDGERLHTASCQAPSPGLHRLLHAAWLKPAKARNQAKPYCVLVPGVGCTCWLAWVEICGARTLTSTRRFCLRPSRVLLGWAGESLP